MKSDMYYFHYNNITKFMLSSGLSWGILIDLFKILDKYFEFFNRFYDSRGLEILLHEYYRMSD